VGFSFEFDFKKRSDQCTGKDSVIALCGGSFDPFHLGHELLGKKVKDALAADYVVYLPSYHSPWKADQTSPFDKRYELIRTHLIALAAERPSEDVSFFKLSDLEKHLSPPSYTAKTLDALEELSWDLRNFWWVCGHDVWEGIPHWHRFESVLERINFLVTVRSSTRTKPSSWAQDLYDFKEKPSIAGQQSQGLHKKTGSVVRFFNFEIPGWSSSQCRADLKKDPKRCPEGMRREVHQEILKMDLYET
jgi:nicotinate-nucleotide adenylyltransferase